MEKVKARTGGYLKTMATKLGHEGDIQTRLFFNSFPSFPVFHRQFLTNELYLLRRFNLVYRTPLLPPR